MKQISSTTCCSPSLDIVVESGGLHRMMFFHDAMLLSLGSTWVPHFLDGAWGEIGEWQSRRGWHFIPGGPAAGGYVFGKPEDWLRGFMPHEPLDCINSGTPQLILSLCTTPTDKGVQAALATLETETNPFVIAACAWAVGPGRLTEAVPFPPEALSAR
jgi:hypothetical protein